MDALVLALAPGFVAGFAVQRLLEIVDGVATFVAGKGWTPTLKAFVFALLSIAAGFVIAYTTGLRRPMAGTSC
jgi:uncharacterized membrane protein (Fun14 family)